MPEQALSPQDLCAKLVAFDTTSHKTNLPLIDFIKDYLDGFGVSYALIPDESGEKSSLFATIGPSDRGGIGLSGHTDVVPVTGQNWSSDPFQVRESAGKLYGRGTCDMKGFLACMLAAVPRLKHAQERAELRQPIHLIFSYDEETGCTGVLPMIQQFGAQLPKPKLVIVGEPTNMQIVDAHKSIYSFETEITGHEAHSSMTHLGASAIFSANKMISALDQVRANLIASGGGERFTPPYSTLHIGLIEGGSATNIVPKSCRFKWEMRGLPDLDTHTILQRLEDLAQNEILPEMKKVSPDCAIITRAVNHVPAYAAKQNSNAVSLALSLREQNETFAVSYGTEAGHFENAACPTVICGPGDIEQAHKPDEFVESSQLDLCAQFLDQVIDYACSDG